MKDAALIAEPVFGRGGLLLAEKLRQPSPCEGELEFGIGHLGGGGGLIVRGRRQATGIEAVFQAIGVSGLGAAPAI